MPRNPSHAPTHAVVWLDPTEGELIRQARKLFEPTTA